MATFNYAIPYENRNNETRVIVRVTHKRVFRNVKTPVFLNRSDIKGDGEIRKGAKLDQVNKILIDYRERTAKLGYLLDSMTVDQLIAYLEQPKENTPLDFIEFGRKYAKTYSNINITCALNSLIKFVGRENIDVNELTGVMMRNFSEWLIHRKEKPCKGRAQSLYLSLIKKMLKDMKFEYNDSDFGIVRIKVSPFDKYEIPKVPVPEKRTLSVAQLRKFIRKEVPQSMRCATLAHDVSILSFLLIGMNSTDLFNVSTYENGRISYERMKVRTRRDDKGFFSVLVPPEAEEIMRKYRSNKNGRVFRFSEMYRSRSTFNTAINTGLKQIGMIGKGKGQVSDFPNLEYYAFRHAWASVAYNTPELGIDKYTVHDALNHASQDMKITNMYIDRDFAKIDQANRDVINYVFHFRESD